MKPGLSDQLIKRAITWSRNVKNVIEEVQGDFTCWAERDGVGTDDNHNQILFHRGYQSSEEPEKNHCQEITVIDSKFRRAAVVSCPCTVVLGTSLVLCV